TASGPSGGAAGGAGRSFATSGGSAGSTGGAARRSGVGFSGSIGAWGLLFGGPAPAALAQLAGEPEERVQAEEGEDRDQQAGHRPEGVEQVRARLRVVVAGVGQEVGEARVGGGVARPARLDAVVGVERRGRGRGGEDVVRAVAVVALGDVGGAQVRRLAVERVE